MRSARPLLHPLGHGGHPLDDDDDLKHIAEVTPPPLEVDRGSTTPSGPAIRHTPPLGRIAGAPRPAAAPQEPQHKIKTFDQKLSSNHHDESKWKRQPSASGTGAVHVRSFHCKLTGDSLEFLDDQINQWLDEHPNYEVKQVTTTVGEWSGKLKEPALIVNVWV